MRQSKFKTVAEYEYGQEIKAYWSPLVEAAGLFSEKQTPESVYLLAGTIMSDTFYSQRLSAVLLATSTEDGGPASAHDIGPTVIHAMTAAERADLRARVLKHWGK